MMGDRLGAGKERKNMLKVNNLTKVFSLEKSIFSKERNSFKAVNEVCLNIKDGEIFSIVGESGSGKSTLGKMIVGLLKPDAGEIFFEGKNIRNLSGKELKKIRENIQIVFQDPYASLNPKMKIEKILIEPLLVHKRGDKAYCRKKAEEVIQTVGLKVEDLKRYPHEFSGGQRQRICIARAIILEPKLLVCDEAVSALDVLVQTQIINLLKELQEKYHMAYIFISHDLAVVRYISDRIGVMYAGELVEYGEKQQIFENPTHPYTKLLISSIPSVDPENVDEKTEITTKKEGDISKSGCCPFYYRCEEFSDYCMSYDHEYFEVEKNHFVMCCNSRR